MHKILLLEDNPIELDIIRRMFAKLPADYVLETVETLEQALKRIEQNDIDLLITDLSVPDSVGVGTFIKINSKFPNLSVVVLTNLHDTDIANKLVEIGAQDYINKIDLTVSILQNAVRNALARKQKTNAYTSLEAETIIKKSIKNYKHNMSLFNDRPLSQREPEIFTFFTEFYVSLLPLSRGLGDKDVQNKVKASMESQRDAVLMMKVSPHDFLDVHNHCMQKLSFINVDDEEFSKLSNLVLQEAMSQMYYAYSA